MHATAAAGETLVGTDGDDVMCGPAAADVLDGRGGNDVLRGGGGTTPDRRRRQRRVQRPARDRHGDRLRTAVGHLDHGARLRRPRLDLHGRDARAHRHLHRRRPRSGGRPGAVQLYRKSGTVYEKVDEEVVPAVGGSAGFAYTHDEPADDVIVACTGAASCGGPGAPNARRHATSGGDERGHRAACARARLRAAFRRHLHGRLASVRAGRVPGRGRVAGHLRRAGTVLVRRPAVRRLLAQALVEAHRRDE